MFIIRRTVTFGLIFRSYCVPVSPRQSQVRTEKVRNEPSLTVTAYPLARGSRR